MFNHVLKEPSLDFNVITFCFWRLNDDEKWMYGLAPSLKGVDVDGSQHLVKIFDANPETYHTWAEAYYERHINIKSVQKIYNHDALTPKCVKELNATCDLNALIKEARKIGYPVEWQKFNL